MGLMLIGVIPAKAGIQRNVVMLNSFQHLHSNEIPNDPGSSPRLKVRDDSITYAWIPAFAGMTREENTPRNFLIILLSYGFQNLVYMTWDTYFSPDFCDFACFIN